MTWVNAIINPMNSRFPTGIGTGPDIAKSSAIRLSSFPKSAASVAARPSLTTSIALITLISSLIKQRNRCGEPLITQVIIDGVGSQARSKVKHHCTQQVGDVPNRRKGKGGVP